MTEPTLNDITPPSTSAAAGCAPTAAVLAPEWLRSFHFVGIGGAGMSGIALVLHKRGFRVTGSDLKPSRYVSLLEEAGIPVSIGHRAANLDSPDVVVISSAIPAHNVELQEARRRGIMVVKRAQALAWLMQSGRGLAVCGTHGKTTTTSMISQVLVEAGHDPTFLVGGELNDMGSNARHGEGELVVCEADESDGSLLLLKPKIAVLTNIELDHHSHYLHVEDVQEVFRAFVGDLPPDGLLVYCAEDHRVRVLAAQAPCRTRSYGIGPGADYQAQAVVARSPGNSFEVWRDRQRLARVTLRVPGRHNVLNALACFAVLTELGAPSEQIVPVLQSFSGAVRRFQFKGRRDGVTVVDDYAHHPTELKATLTAAREGDWSRVIAVFQPHLYSRTEFLHNEFAEALLEADVAVVTDVYGAREDPKPGVSGKLIVDGILRLDKSKPVIYLPRLGSIVDYLSTFACPGDLVLTLGAGDVNRVGERFLALA
jgi:UDP-N-acetylmuramate--alanine ligase